MKFCGNCLDPIITSSTVKCMKCNDLWHKRCARRNGMYTKLSARAQKAWLCSMCVSAKELTIAKETLLKIVSHQTEMHLSCVQLNQKLDSLEKNLAAMSEALNHYITTDDDHSET